MSEFQKYRDMAASGASPVQVLRAAKADNMPDSRHMFLIRSVFGLSLPEARAVFNQVVQAKFDDLVNEYRVLANQGNAAKDICRLAREAGLRDFDRIVLIRELFGLSLVEAKEMIIIADGLASSLSEYQERFIPALEEIIASGGLDEGNE